MWWVVIWEIEGEESANWVLLKPRHPAVSAIRISNRTKKQVKKLTELAAKADIIKSINSRIASCSQLLRRG